MRKLYGPFAAGLSVACFVELADWLVIVPGQWGFGFCACCFGVSLFFIGYVDGKLSR